MSSTEPPSRIPPRQQAHETKAAREELSSKGKVEKVREVDPDEETRKKKFLKYYKGIDDEEGPQEERPSPFDLYSGKQQPPAMGQTLGQAPPPGFSDVEDAIIPGPAYTPPPNVQSSAPEEEIGEEDDQEGTAFGSLPQSNDFWDDFALPDQPPSQTSNYREMPGLSKKAEPPKEGTFAAQKKGERHSEEHKKRTKEITKKEEVVRFVDGKVEKKKETHETFEKRRKIEEPSPFGPPGKTTAKRAEKKDQSPTTAPYPEEKKREVLGKAPHEKKEEKTKTSSLFEEPPPQITERQPIPRAANPPFSKQKDKFAPSEKEEVSTPYAPETAIGPFAPPPPGEREGDRRERPKEEHILEIEAPSLPQMPTHIQPMAMAATTQAAPYLTAATVSLFYQMVGTMYVMSGPQGVSRTEVILNNPAYANSKFYGSIITIEKYATAPDSFNIRLSGSHEAVATFKENIPTLLTAFQNGNFSFRVGRLDVEYTLERPIFRRKEKSSDKGETGGGDLGERRNK